MALPAPKHISVRGEGPPVVLVHGIGAARDAWRPIATRLSDGHRVISYDLRGHNGSEPPGKAFSLEDLVDDLDRVVKHAATDEIHLVGHSLGGMISAAFVRDRPEMARFLCLVSSVAGRDEAERQRIRTIAATIRKDGPEETVRSLAENWFSKSFSQTHPDLVEAEIRRILSTPTSVLVNVYEIFANTEMLPCLQDVRVPALLLTGERDLACSPDRNEAMAAAMPDARLAVIHGARHLMLTEAADEIADHLTGFYRSIS